MSYPGRIAAAKPDFIGTILLMLNLSVLKVASLSYEKPACYISAKAA